MDKIAYNDYILIRSWIIRDSPLFIFRRTRGPHKAPHYTQQTWDVGPTLVYCLASVVRRWTNSEPTLDQRLMFAGYGAVLSMTDKAVRVKPLSQGRSVLWRSHWRLSLLQILWMALTSHLHQIYHHHHLLYQEYRNLHDRSSSQHRPWYSHSHDRHHSNCWCRTPV